MFLTGRPSFQIILGKKDLDAILAKVGTAVKEQGAKLCERLADVAVANLSALEEGLGRREMAKRWTKTPVKVSADAISTEVYNRVEDETWRDTTATGTRGGSRYTIQGKLLLEILEYGAKPHVYSATNATMLKFLSPAGEHKSIFHGTLHSPSRGVGAWLYRSESEESSIYARVVHHPGVEGDEFLRLTKDLLEQRLAREVDEFQRQISLELS